MRKKERLGEREGQHLIKEGYSFCSRAYHWVKNELMNTARVCIECAKQVKDHERKLKAGIYGLFYKGFLFYLGESDRPMKRKREHIGKFTSYKTVENKSRIAKDIFAGLLKYEHFEFKVIEFIEDEQERKAREKELLEEHQPPYNILDNPHYNYKKRKKADIDYSLIEHLIEDKSLIPVKGTATQLIINFEE
jgi:hypothetical protein